MPGSRGRGISCLLDSDVVIDFLRRRDYARLLLENWAEKGLLAISTLTPLEVYQGMRVGEEKATNLFLDGLLTVSVDVSIARQAGRILKELRIKGITISIADSIIAATALQLDTTLLSNNVDHYSFPGLKVVRGLEIT
jgi:predicted nucleic acid-binding protein